VLGFFVLAKLMPGSPKPAMAAALPSDMQPAVTQDVPPSANSDDNAAKPPKTSVAVASDTAKPARDAAPGPSLDPVMEPAPVAKAAGVQKPRKINEDTAKSDTASGTDASVDDERPDGTAAEEAPKIKKRHAPAHEAAIDTNKPHVAARSVVATAKKRRHPAAPKPEAPAAVNSDDETDASADARVTDIPATRVARTHRPRKPKIVKAPVADETDETDPIVPKTHRPHRSRVAAAVAQDNGGAELRETVRPARRRTVDSEAQNGDLYHVHLGAFHSRDAADHEVKRARTKGFATQVVPVTRNGRTLYRVQAGAFRERTRAESIKQSLQDASLDASVTEQRH